MEENLAHAGNGPANPSGSRGRTVEEVMQQDIVPATVALRNALQTCQALIGAVAEHVRSPDEGTSSQRESAVAAARLGASSAQMLSALARATDADTRQRKAAFDMEQAILRDAPQTRRGIARRLLKKKEEEPYDPHFYRDDPDCHLNYSDEDDENLEFNSAEVEGGGENLENNSPNGRA